MNDMEQFNLEEYLKTNRKVVTRDGKSVRIVCTDMIGTSYPVLAVCRVNPTHDCYYSYTLNGKHNNIDSRLDLFFASEKQECPFKKGDRVLVRDYDTESWRPRIFSSYDSYDKECEYKYECEGDDDKYIQCIPYNEHTWKLLGTTDEYKEE